MPAPQPNLSQQEQKTLKSLKKKDLVLLPSDKGTEFCAIETKKYKEAGMVHLQDNNTYKSTKVAPSTIEKAINST